jgi:hypothetical protein
MSKQHETGKAFDPSQAIIAAIDRAFHEDSPEITQEQLDESRKLADKYEELQLQGYSEDQIDALWKGKTPQEILASPVGNGHTSQISLDSLSLAQLERIASRLHFEDDIPKNANRIDMINLIENGVRRTGKQQQLADALKNFEV